MQLDAREQAAREILFTAKRPETAVGLFAAFVEDLEGFAPFKKR